MFGVFVFFDLHLYFESWTSQHPKSFARHYFSSDYVESIKWDALASPPLLSAVRCRQNQERYAECNCNGLKLSEMD